jgi:hypothetical protein
MARKPKKGDALTELLSEASHKVLSKLIVELATEFPDVRRECFDFLKSQVSVSEALVQRSEGEAILALWFELASDLEELDDYGYQIGLYVMKTKIRDKILEDRALNGRITKLWALNRLKDRSLDFVFGIDRIFRTGAFTYRCKN